MRNLIGLIMFAVTLSFGMTTLTYAADEMTAPGPQSFKGELLKI